MENSIKDSVTRESDMEPETVLVRKYMAIFAAIYSLLDLSINSIYVGVFGGTPISGSDFTMLMASAVPAGYAFARKHGRTFNKIEYRRILLGSVIVDAVWHLIAFVSVFTTQAAKVTPLGGIGIFVLSLGMHTLGLAFLYSSTIVSWGIKRKATPE